MNNFFDFKKLLKINKNIILIVLVLFFFGIITLYSANNMVFYPLVFKQLLCFIAFIPIMILIISIDIDFLYKNSYIMYVISILLLLYTDFFGLNIMGARRWIKFFSFNIQTSEIAKISTMFALARYFSKIDKEQITNIRNLIIPSLIIIFPSILIINQPDLGSACILLVAGFSVFYLIGVEWYKFAIAFIIILAILPIFWKYGIKDYQKKRIEVFLNINVNELSEGYNKKQSLISIGSGGVFGKGYGNGTQNRLSFLPENHTDFIFSTFAEEFGFIYEIFIILLYFILIVMITILVIKSKYTFNKIILFYSNILLFLHIFINIGMVSGLLPIVGIPLPFFSYGGTMMIISLTLISLVIKMDIN